MNEPKRPLKVFLCHAHADRDPVRGLYARLTKDGVDRYAWLDKEKLLPGQDWELEIRKAWLARWRKACPDGSSRYAAHRVEGMKKASDFYKRSETFFTSSHKPGHAARRSETQPFYRPARYKNKTGNP
jgi:hypothetical protein